VVRSERPPATVATSDIVYYEPEIDFFSPVGVRLKAHTFLTPIEIGSATPIARSQGHVVGCRKALGTGEVFYFGTNLGASIFAGNDKGIALLRSIITPVLRPAVTSDKVRPRLIEGSERSLLTIFNDTPEDQNAPVTLPSRYRKAVNIHTGEQGQVGHGVIQLSVPYNDAVVLELTL
jgi:hypothetical protein